MRGRLAATALLLATACTFVASAARGAPADRPADAAEAPAVVAEGTDGPLHVRLAARPAAPAPGVPVELRITAAAPPGPDVEIAWPDLRAELTAALGEDVVEVESVRLAPDRRALDARLRLYDEGRQELPPLTIRALRDGAPLGVVTLEGVAVEVSVDVPEDAEPAPARDALPLVVPPAPFPWLPAGAAVAVVAALLVALVLWRRRPRVEPPPPPPPPPHEKALAALRSLAERSLPARGEVDPYFVELSEILRTYLEERFGLRAPEQTTEEFLATVSLSEAGRRAIEDAHRDLLRDFLTRADLVKFARARPGPEECGAAGTSAERFVRETAPRDVVAEAER